MKSLLRFFLFLPALVQTQNSLGQDSVSKLAAVISPALFVPVSVAAQVGLQFRLNKKLSLLAEGAFPTFYPQNTEYEKISYWRTSLEAKYFYRRKADLYRYFALQVAYLMRELMDRDQAFYYTKTQTFSYSNAKIKTPALSAGLKWGVEISSGRRLFVDAFAGAGARFIFTSYQTNSPLVTSLEPRKHNLFRFEDAWLYNYTLMRLHATAGVRVGWKFGKS